MNYFKKVNPLYLILFILLVGFFIFTPTQNVEAAAQCNANGTVSITSDEIMPIYSQYFPAIGNYSYREYNVFPGYFDCANFCPGHSLGNATCNYVGTGYLCSSSYTEAYPFKHGPSTYPYVISYPSSLDYCTAGIPGGGTGGTYCVPSNFGCQGATLVGENNFGNGWCEKVYNCSSTVFTGQWRNVSASSCSVVGSQPGCSLQSGEFGFCQFSKPVGSYTESYYCGTSNPPTGVDVDATIWTSSARSTTWSSQTGDGPLWAYSQAPYRISWGAVTNADSCSLSLNGGAPTNVSTSDGNINTYTVALNQNTLTYTLTCSNSSGSTSDTVTIYIPPKPTPNTASCPLPGTTGSFSWIASTQNVGGTSTWNTFDTQVTNNTTSVVLGAPGTATNFVGTSKSFTTPDAVPGNTYTWLVKTKHTPTGAFSDQISGSFTCASPGVPDLTASTPTESSATVGVLKTFTSTISNIGAYTTGSSFYNSLQIATGSNGSGAITPLTAATPSPLSALGAGASASVSGSYTFSSGGTYSVRFCADNNTSMVGSISEVDDNNNCSSWRDVTVSSSGGVTTPSCSDPTNPTWYSTNGPWGYRKIFAIDDAKVPSSLTNFPVLISTTSDSNLKSTANGGNVTNSNGYDIIFTNSSGVKLDHEIEKYNPTTGELVAWVRLPSLAGSGSGDTKIYMYYGNSNITTSQQNIAGVWDSNYRGVWHLPNGTTLSFTDSTSYLNNGTSANSPVATAGLIDGSVDLESTESDAVNITDSVSLSQTGAITLSAWIRAESLDGVVNENKGIIAKWQSQTGALDRRSYLLGVAPDTDKIIVGVNPTGLSANNKLVSSNGLLTVGNWHYVVMTFIPSSSVNIYINGVLDKSDTASVPASIHDNISDFWLGRQFNSTSNAFYFDGIIDEARVSSIARSAQWIATEYNNQSTNPYNNFYGVSTQCISVPVATLTATPSSGTAPASTTLTWSSTNGATSCTAGGGWSGTKASSNAIGQLISGLMSNTSFTLYCTNASGDGPVSNVSVAVSSPSTTYNLIVDKTIGGYVRSGDGNINCGTSCSSSYSEGTNVTLTAYPNTSYWKFVAWTGDCFGTNPICTINVNGNKSVSAIFAPRSFIYEEF